MKVSWSLIQSNLNIGVSPFTLQEQGHIISSYVFIFTDIWPMLLPLTKQIKLQTKSQNYT